MVGNTSMSLRELYTTVLESHHGGWTTSYMSGMPAGVESIVGGYDLVVMELGRADSAERVAGASLIRSAGVEVVTHVEGHEADRYRDQLSGVGVVVVSSPLTGEHIGVALDQVASRRKTSSHRLGARERLRRFLGR